MKIIGTGIDIISIKRLGVKLRKNPALADKLFTPKELVYVKSKKNYIQNMAGRFAAKEAVYKVMCDHVEGLYWKDIEILSNGSKPVFSEDCRISLYLKDKGYGYSLSISHEVDYAVAHAVFWE